MFIFWTVFCVCLLHGLTCKQFQTNTFVKYTPSYIWPTRLSPVWNLRSRLECAAKCIESYPHNCHGYMYSNSTKLCTPCSGLSPLSEPPLSSEGDFYFHDSCQSYPDFERYTYSFFGIPWISVYAGYFSKPLNYTDAEATCRSMNSHLFVAKSMDRYSLYISIGRDEYNEWIGLDDMETEGHFVWADDGEELDDFMKWYLFRAPQPDNSKGMEDCVYKRATSESVALTLNDASCSLVLPYICENPHC